MDFDVKLIEEVQKYEHIYNFKHQNHRKRDVLQNSWRSIALTMDTDVQTVQKRWKTIRDKFVKERKKPSGSAAFSVWPLFQMLLFLTDHVQHRQSSSNFRNPGKENDKPHENNANDDSHLERESRDIVLDNDNECENHSELNRNIPDKDVNEGQYADTILKAMANGDDLDLDLNSDIMEINPEEQGSTDERQVCSVGGSGDPYLGSSSNFASRKSKLPKNLELRDGKKKKSVDTDTNHLMNMLKSTDDLILNACQSKKALDKDDLFGQQVAEELKCLSSYKNSLAKVKIQEILMEVKFSEDNH